MHTTPLVGLGIAAALSTPQFEARQACVTESLRVRQVDADVVICDPQTGLALRSDAGRGTIPLRVLIVAINLQEAEIRLALQRGVLGYVQLNASAGQLRDAVIASSRGTRHICSSVAQYVAGSVAHKTLTGREVEVTRLLCLGLSNKAIARRLDLAAGTVKVHVRSIMEKLNAESRTEVAALAIRRGLVPDQAFEALESTAMSLQAAPAFLQETTAEIAA